MSNEKKVLRDVELNWVFAYRPDQFGQYSVDAICNDEHVAQLAEDGIETKEKNGNQVYVFKKQTKSKAGEDLLPVHVYDVNGEEFTRVVPNGTIGDVYYTPFKWKAHFGEGVKGRIAYIKLKQEVEPYNPEAVSDI